MRSNVINLLRKAGDALIREGDTGTAYAVHEAVNNLLLVMRGEASLEDWNKVYSDEGCMKLDLDKHIPPIPGIPEFLICDPCDEPSLCEKDGQCYLKE